MPTRRRITPISGMVVLAGWSTTGLSAAGPPCATDVPACTETSAKPTTARSTETKTPIRSGDGRRRAGGGSTNPRAAAHDAANDGASNAAVPSTTSGEAPSAAASSRSASQVRRHLVRDRVGHAQALPLATAFLDEIVHAAASVSTGPSTASTASRAARHSDTPAVSARRPSGDAR